MTSYKVNRERVYVPYDEVCELLKQVPNITGYEWDNLIADNVGGGDHWSVDEYATFREAETACDMISSELDEIPTEYTTRPDGKHCAVYEIVWIEEEERDDRDEIQSSSMHNIYTNVTKYQDIWRL